MPLCTRSIGPSVGRISHLPVPVRLGEAAADEIDGRNVRGVVVAQHPGIAYVDLADPVPRQ